MEKLYTKIPVDYTLCPWFTVSTFKQQRGYMEIRKKLKGPMAKAVQEYSDLFGMTPTTAVIQLAATQLIVGGFYPAPTKEQAK